MRTGLFLLILPLLILGCQPPQAAQTALTTCAHALVAVDDVVAPAYASDHAGALEDSETQEEYDAAMQTWNSVEEGMRVTRQALLSAQDALNAWQASATEATFRASLPALLGALRGLLDLLMVARVDVPTELHEALGLVTAFLEVEDG